MGASRHVWSSQLLFVMRWRCHCIPSVGVVLEPQVGNATSSDVESAVYASLNSILHSSIFPHWSCRLLPPMLNSTKKTMETYCSRISLWSTLPVLRPLSRRISSKLVVLQVWKDLCSVAVESIICMVKSRSSRFPSALLLSGLSSRRLSLWVPEHLVIWHEWLQNCLYRRRMHRNN